MFPARSTLGSEAAQINQLIATVRRRSLAIDALKYLALLSCAVFGVAIVCLLFGTDVFPAALVYLVLLALFVVWVVVVRRARKSPSVVARTVDDKLALQDTLSTAYFLLNEPSQKPGPWDSVPVKQAADLASGIQPRQAFPLEGLRWWSVAAALAVVALGFFITRYMLIQTLSLRPPLMNLSIPPLLARMERTLGVKEILHAEALKPSRDKAQANSNGQRQQNAAEHAETELPKPLPSVNPGTSQGHSEKANEIGRPKGSAQQTPSQPGSKSSEQAPAQDSSPVSRPNSSPANASENSQQSPKNENTSAGSNASSQPSLMSRMKDALSNMMAKVSPQAAGEKTPNAGDPSGKNGQKGQQQSQAGNQQAGQQGKGEQAKSDSQDNTNGQGDGQTAEKAGNAQGRSGSDSQQKGNEAQSGVGKQDGDKAIRDAEQQRAMGKLAEIIGKRSADLTGDMSVETPSGNQQLKTAYSQHQGKHSDASGEINSNEVPLRYQQYVRQYMEAVRKTNPPAN